ncbi:hypothetical protein [Crassaminicella profunda]|uniref:hypothetical protein n=1 Tax=Crassaminicella profunda TaxID=1286698 RepID=UPI001CA70D73|nr:hypothetical protein [Crassaminicella profunda]QZY54920.1 hypothetical protein K7H06_18160 [Crassaminicella profunda]
MFSIDILDFDTIMLCILTFVFIVTIVPAILIQRKSLKDSIKKTTQTSTILFEAIQKNKENDLAFKKEILNQLKNIETRIDHITKH